MGGEMNSKELVRRLFQSDVLPRVPFLPWIFSHAANLEQIPVRSMATDAGQLARTLQNAWKLYGYDVVASSFDLTLEAEACGCSVAWQGEDGPTCLTPSTEMSDLDRMSILEPEKKGRLPVVLDAMRRVMILAGQTVAVAAVVTGPFSLTARLLGKNVFQELETRPEETKRVLNQAGQLLAKLCRSYGELEPDLIVIVEEQILKLPSRHITTAVALFRTLGNLIRFYDARSVIVTRIEPGDQLELIGDLSLDGAVIGGEPDPEDIKGLVNKGLTMGIGIPLSVIHSPGERLSGFLSRYLEPQGNKRLFLSTEWEVPHATPPEVIHQLVKHIRRIKI